MKCRRPYPAIQGVKKGVQVQIQPLSQAIQQVDKVAARWFRALNDTRWNNVGASDKAQYRTLRVYRSHTKPMKLRLSKGDATLNVVIDQMQWPAIGVLQQIDDHFRKEAVLNLLAYQTLSSLHEMGCEIPRCHLDADAHLDPASIVSVQLFGYTVDLYPNAESEQFLNKLQTFLNTLAVPVTPRLVNWPLATIVMLGSKAFLLSRLNALRVGDWVLWNRSEDVGLYVKGAENVKTSELLALCQLNAKDLIVEEIPNQNTHFIKGESDAAEHLQTICTTLKVIVRFEIDGPSMTVATAVGLAPGDVIVLPAPVDQARVALRCQGRCFAYGELVAVGGQVGVRVLEVAEQNA